MWAMMTDKGVLLLSVNTCAWSLIILMVIILPYQSHVRVGHKDIDPVNTYLMLKTQQLLYASG